LANHKLVNLLKKKLAKFTWHTLILYINIIGAWFGKLLELFLFNILEKSTNKAA